MRRQRGLSLTGMIMVSFILVIVALFGLKIVPVYMEYAKVNKQFKAIAENPQVRAQPNIANVKAAYYRQTAVDEIKSLDGETITVRKEGGSVIVEAEYSVKVPLIKNFSACMDFHASSEK